MVGPVRVKKKLDEFVESHFHGQNIKTEVLMAEDPIWQTICNYSKENDYNLIVMSSHGHGALAQLLMGSTVSHVVPHAGCPVLVIPPADE